MSPTNKMNPNGNGSGNLTNKINPNQSSSSTSSNPITNTANKVGNMKATDYQVCFALPYSCSLYHINLLILISAQLTPFRTHP